MAGLNFKCTSERRERERASRTWGRAKREDGTPTLARTRFSRRRECSHANPQSCFKRVYKQARKKKDYAYRRGENGNGFRICEFMLEHSFAVRATVELHCSFSQLCALRALRASRSSYCHIWCTWCRWPICLRGFSRVRFRRGSTAKLGEADSREPRSDGVVTSRNPCLQTDAPVVQMRAGRGQSSSAQRKTSEQRTSAAPTRAGCRGTSRTSAARKFRPSLLPASSSRTGTRC